MVWIYISPLQFAAKYASKYHSLIVSQYIVKNTIICKIPPKNCTFGSYFLFRFNVSY